jgi:hypothetical protein
MLTVTYTGPDGQVLTAALTRFKLIPKEGEYPFEWARRQFAIKPAFAMTINKSQGQTLKRVGVWLPQPVFTHGQLYVAASRVGDPEKITFAILPEDKMRPNYTRNVVFKEVLLGNSSGTSSGPQDVTAPPTEPLMDIPDISEWTDYDMISDEEEEEIDGAEFSGLPLPPRRIQEKQPPVRLSCTPATNAAPTPPLPTSPTWPNIPKGDYEMFRDANVAELEAEFERIFGEPLNKSASISTKIFTEVDIMEQLPAGMREEAILELDQLEINPPALTVAPIQNLINPEVFAAMAPDVQQEALQLAEEERHHQPPSPPNCNQS